MAAPTGMGVNFAQDYNCYTDNAVCRQQLTVLKNLGINRIRINVIPWDAEFANTTFRDQLRLVATTAKGMGFYVSIGYKGNPLTAANQASFKSAQRLGAAWAQANGIDEWIVGNEEDLTSTLSASALRAALQDVCQTIKQTDNFPGVVSTAITTNVYSAWAAEVATWSQYMKLDLHIYFAVGATGGASFDSYATTVPAALGAGNVYCGEFGVNGAAGNGRMSSAFGTDGDWIREIVRRAKLLEDNGWQSYYYFAYAIQGDANEELRWSAYRTSQSQFTPLLEALARKRPRYISTGSALYDIRDYRRKSKNYGKSLSFSGSAGQVTFGTSNPFTGSFIVSLWVYWLGTNGNFHTILAKRNSYAADSLLFSMSINTSGVLALDTVTSFVNWGYTFPIKKWTHMTWVHHTAGFTDKLYINGELSSSQGIATLGTKTDALISLGSTEATPTDFFYGNLDDLVISSITNAPTTAEAYQIYAKETYPGTIWGSYAFDEGSGSRAINAQGIGPDGVISGTTYSDEVVMHARSAVSSRTAVSRSAV